MADIRRFVREVEKDVAAFNPDALRRLGDNFRRAGLAEINKLHAFMVEQRFPGRPPNEIPPILMALRQRHANRWNRAVGNAFSVAADTIPEFANPVRARDASGTPRSILARRERALGSGQGDPGTNAQGGRTLLGVARTTRGPNRRRVNIPLIAQLKLLINVTPRNLRRDFVALLQRIESPRGSPALYRVSAGRTATTCQTCAALNGRVLTRGALNTALTRLKPVLFHPNCRHALETQGLQGVSLDEYDARRFGELITEEVLAKMIRNGTVETQAPRRPFVTV